MCQVYITLCAVQRHSSGKCTGSQADVLTISWERISPTSAIPFFTVSILTGGFRRALSLSGRCSPFDGIFSMDCASRRSWIDGEFCLCCQFEPETEASAALLLFWWL